MSVCSGLVVRGLVCSFIGCPGLKTLVVQLQSFVQGSLYTILAKACLLMEQVGLVVFEFFNLISVKSQNEGEITTKSSMQDLYMFFFSRHNISSTEI